MCVRMCACACGRHPFVALQVRHELGKDAVDVEDVRAGEEEEGAG